MFDSNSWQESCDGERFFPGVDAADWDPLLARNGGGITDSQLIERFLAKSGADSEDAFAALVERYGRMVWGVCRRMLPRSHDAEDAFQAAFLVLARRAGSIVKKGQLPNWLYSVAVRTASEVRRRDRRLRAREKRAVEASQSPANGDTNDDLEELLALLDLELAQLPDRYRAAVLLCELEGLSRREAADRLMLAEGTLSSRLARGRRLLRDRLLRRGVTLSAAPGAILAEESIAAALPPNLAASTVKISVTGAAIPAAVASLAHGVLNSMLLTELNFTALALVLAVVGLATGSAARLVGPSMRADENAIRIQEPAAMPVAAGTAGTGPNPDATIEMFGPYSWRGRGTYEPPDFYRFFPDDRAGGKLLDDLWAVENLGKRPTAEILRIVRQGLRRTSEDRDRIIGHIGETYIWSAAAQNPDAIEIMYHAADPRGPIGNFGDSSPVYYGLSVVRPKPPAILHSLVDLCMQTENRSNWGRIAWGATAQRAELLGYLRPYLESKDEATRDKASVLVKVLSEAPDQNEAVVGWVKKTVRARSGHRLLPVREALQSGTSRERLDAINSTLAEELYQIMDDSFVEAFRACSSDQDPALRKELTRVLGVAQRVLSPAPAARVVDLLLRLSEDANAEVRYYAVYQGLTPLPEARHEAVVRRLITLALPENKSDLGSDMMSRIAWGLSHEQSEVIKVLDELIKGGDQAQAKAAKAVYKQLSGQFPPGVEKSDPDTRKGYVKAFHELHQHLGQVYPNFALKGIDWEKVGRELIPRVGAIETADQFGLLVEELVARLEDSHALVLEGTATPPNPGMPEWDGLGACLIDDRGRPVVYCVLKLSSAWKAGVRVGMAVVSVNGIPAEEAINQWMKRQRTYYGYSSERYLRYDAARWFHRQSKRGDKVRVELEDQSGRRFAVTVSSDYRGWYIPRLPVPRLGIEDGGADVQSIALADRIGYIHVRRMRQGLEASLDQALNSLGDIKGLIIDVRGNSGGGFDVKTAFQNFDQTGDNAAARHRPHYDGPIALLIDERCISAGEGWASWFVAKKRARLFGTTTAGASSRKETYALTNGMYKVVIPVKAYTGFLDRPIERRGIEPDVEVRCNANDLARGRDTVVQTALRWLTDAIGPQR
jgi:RNA polymerase sigma factor (sigma-70 family)